MMRNTSLLGLALASLFGVDATASDVRLLKFPGSVIGSWTPAADSCGGSGQGTINISPTQHSSKDVTCKVAWITVTASRDGPVYSARSNCTKVSSPQNKNGKNEPPSYFVVSPRPDGKLLVRLPGSGPDDDMVNYQKCL